MELDDKELDEVTGGVSAASKHYMKQLAKKGLSVMETYEKAKKMAAELNISEDEAIKRIYAEKFN